MKRMQKGVAALLCALLFVGLSPAVASAAGIREGTPAFALNETVVAFAGREWYVIGDGTSGVSPQSGHLTLLAKDSFGDSLFRMGASTQDDPSWTRFPFMGWYFEGNYTTPCDYNDSRLMNFLEARADALPANEAVLIKARRLDDVYGAPVSGQKLWPLSLNEYESMGMIPGETPSGPYWWFWLRSGDSLVDAYVGISGGGMGGNPYGYSRHTWTPSVAVRPALQLNLSSLLFTSDAGGASSKSFAEVGSGLVGAAAPTQNFKFTMKDSAQTLVVLATTAQSTQSGASLLLSYTGATAGENQYVSCVLLDELGAVKYYGKLADSSSVDRGILDVPLSGVSDGTYTLKIFSEQANGDMHTDFASTPIAMKVAVSSGSGTVSGFGGTILPGIGDGREIDLRVNATHIQWRYTGESDDDWRDLIALSALTGADGREVELQADGGYIQWRYAGESSWSNIVSLSAIMGPQGEQGPAGADGVNGTDGADGRGIGLRNSGTSLQWRYAGETIWNDLVTLATLTGVDGQDGVDGREVELQVDGGYIQWRYAGGSWTNLMAVSVATGPQGAQGPAGTAGANGRDGTNGSNGADGRDGSDGADGLNGKDGSNGVDGRDGQNGKDGKDGNGILSIAKTGSEGNVDTYTISFTDGTSTTFTITNGKGGVGVASAAWSKNGELVFTLTDGTQINLGPLPGTAIPASGAASGDKGKSDAAVPVAAGAASGAVASGLLYQLLPLLRKKIKL